MNLPLTPSKGGLSQNAFYLKNTLKDKSPFGGGKGEVKFPDLNRRNEKINLNSCRSLNHVKRMQQKRHHRRNFRQWL